MSGATDLGDYFCEVTMDYEGGHEGTSYKLSTDYFTLGVKRRAVVQPGAFDNAGRLGLAMNLQLTADSSMTRYNVLGLPRGMTYDPRTGIIGTKLASSDPRYQCCFAICFSPAKWL